MCRYREKPWLEHLKYVDLKDFKEELKQAPNSIKVSINGQDIPLCSMPLNYGGKRFYFHCVYCSGKARKMFFYFGWKCKACTGLHYRSQGQSKEDNALHQAAKREAKLDDWDKPKWMRWPTYERICDEIDYYRDLSDQLYFDRMAAKPMPKKLLRLLNM